MVTSHPIKRRPFVGAVKRRAFLARLSECGQVNVSARAAAVATGALYKERQASPEFAQEWADAIDIAMLGAESEVFRRAVDGVEKPVTVAGVREVVRQHSDVLLMFLLKAHKPEKYRDNYRAEGAGDIPDFDRWANDTEPDNAGSN